MVFKLNGAELVPCRAGTGKSAGIFESWSSHIVIHQVDQHLGKSHLYGQYDKSWPVFRQDESVVVNSKLRDDRTVPYMDFALIEILKAEQHPDKD